ncbi:MAG: cupin-like domain-containing protein, partial [Bacteroidota bacterium]
METSTKQSSVSGKSTITSIDRHKNLSPKELLNEYVIPGLPVILTEAALQWKAMKKWTPEFFKTKYGHLEREVKGGKKVKLGDYMEMMFHSTDENPSPYPYNYDIFHYFPELLEDIKPTLLFGKMDRLSHPLLPKSMLLRTHAHELHIGGRGGSFPLHFDTMFLHTQQTQILGDKEYYFFSPDQSEFLYPEEENPTKSKLKHVFNVDLEKFPLYKNAKPIHATVHIGETLFFPTQWWHTTYIPIPSITYGRSHLNTYNYKNYLKDYKEFFEKKQPAKTRILYTYGKM